MEPASHQEQITAMSTTSSLTPNTKSKTPSLTSAQLDRIRALVTTATAGDAEQQEILDCLGTRLPQVVMLSGANIMIDWIAGGSSVMIESDTLNLAYPHDIDNHIARYRALYDLARSIQDVLAPTP